MVLSLNIFTLFFITLVAVAVIAASSSHKNDLFYLLSAILIIPILSQIRQILFISGFIQYVPYYVFLVYILIRLLGPLINWHTHRQVGRQPWFFSPVFLLTYTYMGYMVIYLGYRLFTQANPGEYTIQTFQRDSFISSFYPVLQLAHVGQSGWLLFREKVKRNGLIFFMRIMVISTLSVLVLLQIGYLFLERQEVELVLVPIIFCLIYAVIAGISIRYSSLHSHALPPFRTSVKQIEALSNRENEVLQKLSEGKTDKEIANEIHLSQHTVRTYCKRIYAKLNIKNRTEAASFYHQYP